VQRLELGGFGHIESGANGDRAWADTSFAEFQYLEGDFLQQAKMQHPFVIAADWRKYFDNIAVDRVDTIDGQKSYVVTLTMSSDVSCTSYINTDTGLVMQEEVGILHKGAGRINTTFTYGDYKEVEGVRLPMRISISNELNGEVISTIDKVEVNIQLPGNAFTPKVATVK
jgi:hypothetical protein